MSAHIYIEGGGDSKEMHVRCREAFRRLLESSRFRGRMPRLIACGGRNATFDAFKTAHEEATAGSYVAMWIDSEDPMVNIEQAWSHLKKRDGWEVPASAEDEQVLLMVTCMESWIVADQCALHSHYGNNLQTSGLPALCNLESKDRYSVQNALEHSTRNCKNAYAKGKRSFEILGKLNPVELRKHLPSFVRCERILGKNL